MATELVTARETAELVRPVRALLKQNKRIEAVRLVRERMDCGLKESLEFVNHVQALPGVKALKIAELWTSENVGESISDTPDHKAELVGTSNGDARTGAGGTDMSLAELYARYMETHTYSEWEQLVEKCLAAKTTEEEL
jgi:hypothetical protein